MLTFLAIACKKKFVLDSYEDEAVGHMEKNADGKLAITRVELRPKITWSGDRRPSPEELEKMHHSAHENCFIGENRRDGDKIVARATPTCRRQPCRAVLAAPAEVRLRHGGPRPQPP